MGPFDEYGRLMTRRHFFNRDRDWQSAMNFHAADFRELAVLL